VGWQEGTTQAETRTRYMNAEEQWSTYSISCLFLYAIFYFL